ncbi:MAG TPA: DotU family type IV/VI secretion system protein [Alphaproteobacteria bacterium]|nr:DotU family type IV/VI secretion system protein [Alphaproteobacteria bacterium]
MKQKNITLNRYLVNYFQNFYFEVIRLKEKVVQAEDFQDLEDSQSEELPPQEVLALSIQRKLKTILNDQQIKISKQAGDYTLRQFQEALYIMAALADEVFLTLDWFGRKIWKEHLLEKHFFQTQLAGEQFFTRLDDLLSSPDALRKEIAPLYLLSLGLGFKGKFTKSEDLQKLNAYQKKLFEVIEGHSPKLYQDDERVLLMPECYEHTILQESYKKLPDIRRWTFAFLSVIGVYLFASYFLWYKLVQGMDETVHTILNQSRVAVPS